MKDKTAALATLRELKGIPFTLLFALFIANEPTTQTWLSNALGYQENTIRKYLRYLLLAGYVERVGPQRWRLQRGRLQLPGFELGPAPGSASALPTDPQGYPQVEAATHPEAAKFAGFASTTTCSKQVKETKSSRSSSDQKPENIPISPELAAVLQEAGIGRNLWPELSALPHITPGYVRAQLARVMAHPDAAKRTTGFLIHVLRCGDPAPEVCEHCQGTQGEHRLGCPERYGRYTKGKYAHLLEH